MRLRRPTTVLLSAVVIAGCGGAGTDADPTSAVPPAKPATGGHLRVDATGLGLGAATTGSAAGVRLLPDTRVAAAERHREGVGGGASCAGTDLAPAAANLDEVVDATLCLLNGERADAGLAPLRADTQLADAARDHSAAMIRGSFFDHVAPDGSSPVDRIRRSGYIPDVGRWVVGENLAWGTGALATPKSIVKAWMGSEGHRANVLRGEYDDIGFGVTLGTPKARGAGATYTTTFGARPAAAKAKRTRRKGRKLRSARRARITRRSAAR